MRIQPSLVTQCVSHSNTFTERIRSIFSCLTNDRNEAYNPYRNDVLRQQQVNVL